MTTKQIVLQAWEDNDQTVPLHIGEYEAKVLNIKLLHGSIPIDLTNRTVTLYTKLLNGINYSHILTVKSYTDSIVVFTIPLDITTSIGELDCYIEITESNGTIIMDIEGLKFVIN